MWQVNSGFLRKIRTGKLNIKTGVTSEKKPEAGHGTNRGKGLRAVLSLGRGSAPFLKPGDAYLLSFLLPVLVMLVIFSVRGIYPFGSESFLRIDMYHQYAPFFMAFRDKLTHADSLLYTWNIGLGMNFLALYVYYLASPLNFLLFLVPRGLVIEFMTLLVLLKIGLCGLSMCVYLRRHYLSYDLGSAFFAVFYALSAYIAAYSWNIMWLDCIVLFPLMILGLERLHAGGRPYLYIATLALSILSNYYISLMICIFLVLYEGFLLLNEPGHPLLKSAARFAGASLLGGGLAMALLVPEIYALRLTASGDFSFPKNWMQYFGIFDILSRQLWMVASEEGLDHWPNIYCGMPVFLFALLYFQNTAIRLREKLLYLVLLVLFWLGFSVNIFNFIWHGLHYPNSLPARQSFIYIFLLLSMGYHAYRSLSSARVRQLHLAFALSSIFIVLAQKLVTDDAFGPMVFYGSMIWLLLYYALFYLRGRRRLGFQLFSLLLMLLACLELSTNMLITSVPTTSRKAYLSDNREARELLAVLESQDTDFYRIIKAEGKTKNDGAWLNFPSASVFSSTAYSAVSKLYEQLGCEGSTNAYAIQGATPLVKMLFDIRYELKPYEPAKDEAEDVRLRAAARDGLPGGGLLLSEQGDFAAASPAQKTGEAESGELSMDKGGEPGIASIDEAAAPGVASIDEAAALPEAERPVPRLQSLVQSSTHFHLLKNEFTLPLGFVMSEAVLEEWHLAENAPAAAQNSLARLLGASPVLVETEGRTQGDSCEVLVEESGLYFAYISNQRIKKVSVSDEYSARSFDNVDRGYLLELGYLSRGRSLSLRSDTEGQDMSCQLYRFDAEALKQVYEALKPRAFQLKEQGGDSLSATVSMAHADRLVFSIPYDPSWKIYVDGKPAMPQAAAGGLLSVSLQNGTHELKLRFEPQGLKLGLVLSALSLLCLGAFYFVNDWRKK